ncbi:MAG: HDOD domain-containing protein [Rhodocyclales bacterium]|nr:HDOD domain-containing protein [Rhodocyclales bacterium]
MTTSAFAPASTPAPAPLQDVDAILASVAAAAESDDLVFPTTAELSLKVQHLIDDPDCSVDSLAKLVQADPLLAARVVAVANSVAYNRSGRSVADVRSAVSRLGLNTLRVLAASVVVRQMEGMAGTPAHRKLAIALWEHTAHVAALAQVIARRVTRVNPDTAFFAGIIHEIGGFYLIARAGAYPGLLEAANGSLLAWDEGGAAEVGRAVLKHLGAPGAVIEAIEGLWQGYLALPPQSLADTLLLADLLAPVESPLSQLAGIGREGTKVDIDVAIDDQTLASILDESKTEVESLIAALRA